MPLLPRVVPEVAEALDAAEPVVALESTIFSHLGLPSPANREALERCLAVVRAGGAVPAVTAVLDGVPGWASTPPSTPGSAVRPARRPT